MKVSEDSKKELSEVLAMYYDSILIQCLENYKFTFNPQPLISILDKYEMNIQCIINLLLRGKKRGLGLRPNEAEDRFIRPEIFTSRIANQVAHA